MANTCVARIHPGGLHCAPGASLLWFGMGAALLPLPWGWKGDTGYGREVGRELCVAAGMASSCARRLKSS